MTTAGLQSQRERFTEERIRLTAELNALRAQCEAAKQQIGKLKAEIARYKAEDDTLTSFAAVVSTLPALAEIPALATFRPELQEQINLVKAFELKAGIAKLSLLQARKAEQKISNREKKALCERLEALNADRRRKLEAALTVREGVAALRGMPKGV